MTITTIPFALNHKVGILKVCYEANQSAAKSGFDLFARSGFDVNLCLGYPTMHAYLDSYEGVGYYTGCAWIQVVTRREFASLEAAEPTAVIPSVDTHPTLAELGVPFFAPGFPAEIFDRWKSVLLWLQMFRHGTDICHCCAISSVNGSMRKRRGEKTHRW